jgi:hypothetical protein
MIAFLFPSETGVVALIEDSLVRFALLAAAFAPAAVIV